MFTLQLQTHKLTRKRLIHLEHIGHLKKDFSFMHFSLGSPSSSYQPTLKADTTDAGYWLEWRFFLCAVWILCAVTTAAYLISKYEGRGGQRDHDNGDRTESSSSAAAAAAEALHEPPGILYKDELWRPCIKGIHPAWLLAYRLTALVVLLALLVVNVYEEGGGIFYYYTQWTFTLVTVYFVIGSVISIYGCREYLNRVGGAKKDSIRSDMETGTDINRQNTSLGINQKNSSFPEELNTREIAGFWGYAFQIIYQANAGAVLLTDIVFWLIIVPFLAMHSYRLNLLLVCMHSVNAFFLLGDTALNSMRFPWFRIAYFLLWTTIYVSFQWVVHGCVSIWWPYPFLDLSSNLAPLWYLVVGLMHVPCYALFTLVLRMKQLLLSNGYPDHSLWLSTA